MVRDGAYRPPSSDLADALISYESGKDPRASVAPPGGPAAGHS